MIIFVKKFSSYFSSNSQMEHLKKLKEIVAIAKRAAEVKKKNIFFY